ncbi:MAG: outer membrane lipoprotein-sorting protein [Bacteroidales bacterium]|nr:outer membrane lipoprotein-sorting protein [Bacteroidales bacterium]
MKRILLLTAVGIAFTVSVTGQNESATAILEKTRELTMADGLEATITLTLTDKNGNTRVRKNSMVSKTYSDGTEKRLIRFIAPAEVQGTSILIHDYKDTQDDMWIYLPALRKIRRVVSSEKGKSFMGSEFTNADISSPPASDFVSRHLPGSGSRAGETIIIESIPADAEKISEYGFARRISYFEAGSWHMRKMEFFDKGGVLFKTIEVLSVASLQEDGHYMISEMRAINHVTGRSSSMKMENISSTVKPSDSLFDAQNLNR